MENVLLSFSYRGVTHNLFVNSAIWMKYEGLIGDPREPNSNSLLECVKGLEEGPLHCSAQLTGCCFNGRWEINGDLMTVGRTLCNNRVLTHQTPQTHKHIYMDACRVKMKVSSIDLSVKKFCSHLPSVHPVSSRAKQTELIHNPPNPPLWPKKANLCTGDMVCEE